MGRYRMMGMRGDCIQATGVNSYIEKLLHLSGLTNTGLFAAVTAGCSLVFALFYLLTYRITSRSYYRIVSGGRERE